MAVALLALAFVQGSTHREGGVALASPQERLPANLVPFVLYDRGLALHLTADAATVGEALDDLQVQLDEADLVSPSRDAPLTPGLRVVVRRAKHVLLRVDGGESWVATHAVSVGDLLAERGVFLGALDRVSPEPTARLGDGMSVQVVRVQVLRDVQEEAIVRNVVYRDDPSLLLGQSYVAQEGSDGLVRREYEVVYEDGRETSRRLVAEVTVPAQDRVVVRGTRRPPPPPIAVPASGGGDCSGVAYSRTMTVYATWYAPGRGAGYYTATGMRVGYGIVAVDPSVIPLGTRLCVPGYGMAVAADTGGGVRGYMIDLAYPEGVVPNWRTGYVTIYILD
ncbi:MAG TPA: G5 domain-containing protein [Dehalococcoidia bacterium]|nr:G5 domain-containing protein [Dehalococcoidia bacterium]